MKLLPFFATLFCLFSTVLTAKPPEVELFPEGDTLDPSTTLELRFAQPMVPADQVGAADRNSPLILTPPLPGIFTWLSTRSGVFLPTVAPGLGTTYTVSLRKGQTDAHGTKIATEFSKLLKTPPFQASPDQSTRDKNTVISATPQERLAFNLQVKLEGAEKLFTFVATNGRTVAAKVRYAVADDYFSIPATDEDWQERWKEAQQPSHPRQLPQNGDTENNRDDKDATLPLRNRLIITPIEPLTPGTLWSLQMKPGITSVVGNLQMTQPRISMLGKVDPFALKKLTTENYLNSGRSVALEFSENFAPDVSEKTAGKFFRVTPAIPNLTFETNWQSITLHGDFQLGIEYHLEIDPTLLAESLQPFSGERTHPFRFAPVKPRIYLPALTADQLRNGTRKFPVHSVNLQSIHITAQLIAPESAAQAIEVFEKNSANTHPQSDELHEPYQKIPPSLFKSTPLAERNIKLAADALDKTQETIIDWTDLIGEKKAGIVLLSVEGQPLPTAGDGTKPPGAQTLIQLTDLGVFWKLTDGHLRTTVFSMTTGQVIPDASVALLKKDFTAVLASAATDATGTVSLPVKTNPGWLTVRSGEDTHALHMGPSAADLPLGRFGIYYSTRWPSEETSAEKTNLDGLLFTDRPLYRPGEVVRVKGIVRHLTSQGIKLGPPQNGILTVTYPHERGTQKISVNIDAHGAFDTSFELPPALIGSFQINIDANTESSFQSSTSFQVQEFQPNAFETHLTIPSRFLPAQKVVAHLSANYFFGAPVSDARVQWTLQYSQAEFEPSGFGQFSFINRELNEQSPRKGLTLRGEAKLTASLAIEPVLPQPTSGRFRGNLTVEVTDQNQQTVTENREFFRDASDFYLGVETPPAYVLHPSEEFVVRAVAVRPDGTPQPDPVTVKAELVRVENDTVRVQTAGQVISFKTERREKVIDTAEGKTLLPVLNGELWVAPPGATARFKAVEAGEYFVRLTTQDSAKTTIQATSPFMVSSDEPVSWNYRNASQIDLLADRAEYHPGDIAHILVKTPISGEAWVSVESGESILRSFRVKLQGNAPTLDIPIKPTDTPNVFISVVIIRGAEQSTRKFKTADCRYGVCQLRVTDPQTRLQVALTTARPEVQPGQDVSTEVRVLDAKGAPVANAEVTFWAVDDGILTLTGYTRPQPSEIFDRPFSLAVATGITLFDLLPEDPSDLTFTNKGYLIGGGGVDGPPHKLRHHFPGTACWFPALRTDQDGRVKTHFIAPDALTRFRLLAVVHADANRFGSAESAVGIRKPLMLLSSLGPVANVGDEIIARALIRNETGTSGTAEISLELDSTAQPIKAPLTTKIALENGESRAVDFPVKLVAMGVAGWKWSAQMKGKDESFEDKMLTSLQIGSPIPLLRETYLTELREKTNPLLTSVNPQLLEGDGSVTVTLANTRLASLQECAHQLLTYPYGCAEQLASALLPWIAVKNLGPVLGDLGQDPKALRTAIETGVAKIFALQTSNGGLAYWPGGRQSNLFASAWATVVLAELAKEDFPLPNEWAKLLGYLGKELRDIRKLRDGNDLDQHALVLFALAHSGHPEPAYCEKLATRRNEMSREGRALLALAILEAKGNPAFAVGLLNPTLPSPEITSWFGSATRERAISLMAWTRAKPQSPEVGKLTAELLASRRNGHWRTTQENAWALLALSQYFTLLEREVKPVNGRLVQNTQTFPFQLTKKHFTETTKLAYDATRPLGPLTVENPQRATLYAETRFVARPPVAPQPRQDRGYAVSRRYQKLAADGSLVPATDLLVGDRIVVTLRVATTRPGNFVAIDDPLPAILEAVNPQFRTQQGAVDTQEFWNADYREVRADRVLYFCDHLPPGAFTFNYLARVRSAGTVTAPATKVEEMYRPERFGLSDTLKMTSRPAK